MQKMFRLTVTLTAIVMLVACSDSTDEGNNNNNNNNADTTSSMDSGTTLIQPDTSNVVDINTTAQIFLQQC
jgi:PBP1b-binding outer membrane lipoprotein LpoB